MAEEVIGLLFGVEGGGSVDGASGKQIVKDLTDIVRAINSGNSDVPKIKFHFDTTEAFQAVDDLKKKLKDIEKVASIKVTYSNGGQGGNARGGHNIVQELQTEMNKFAVLQKKMSSISVKIGKLELDNGDVELIAAYRAELDRLEGQYAKLMGTFVDNLSMSAEDIDMWDVTAFDEQIQSLQRIENATVSAAKAKKEAAEADKEQSKIAAQQERHYEELLDVVSRWTKESKTAAKLAAEYGNVTRDLDGHLNNTASGYEGTTQRINATVQAMKQLQIIFRKDKKTGVLEIIKPKDLEEVAKKLGITTEQYEQLFAKVVEGSKVAAEAMEGADRKNQQSWTATSSKIRDEVQRMYHVISKDPNAKKLADNIIKYSQSASGHVGDLKNMYDQLRNVIHASGADIETWGDRFKKSFVDKIRSGITSAMAAAIGKYLHDIYQNVVAIDKATVDLQIATGKSRDEVKALAKEYSQLAKSLGATTSEVMQSADTWLRQGHNAEDANTLITNSTMLSKLGQMEAADAAKALTSAMKGYSVSVDDSVKIVDKFTAVDMEAAASAGDIATALSETAASAKNAGVSMDTLIGYIATVKEVTQDGAESVGTFYRTLFARMNNIKVGKFVDDETGEALNDVEKVLKELGISLRDANDQFRNSDDVINEVGRRWSEFDDIEQRAIATAFAGTKQQEKFMVLMQHFDTAMQYATVSTSSAGTAMEKFGAYTEGIQGKISALTATFEELSITILNSDWIITGVEFLTGILDGLTNIASIGDGIVVVIVAITAAIVLLQAAINAATKSLKKHIAYYAELYAAQTAGAASTSMFTAALIQFTSTGLLGVITAIPRFIAAIIKYGVAAKAGTGATLTFKGALDLLKVNPWVLLIEAIVLATVGAVAAINKFANSAAEASADAKEHAQSMKEAAANAKEEQQALDDLIDKYEELRSKGTVDADTRKEIRDVQKQINLLVEKEISGWDMVNGSLDKTLKKLKDLRVEEAKRKISDYKESYTSAQTSANLAYESDISAAKGWAQFWERWIGVDLVVEGWDKEAVRILNEVEGIKARLSTDYTKSFMDIFLDDVNGAEEHINLIDAAMNALEADMSYDHRNSKVWLQLDKLKAKYETYASAIKDTIGPLLEGVVTLSGATLEANGAAINSLEDYEKFKQSMINAAMSSEDLQYALETQAITQQTVTEAVDDYMATNYADWYNQLAANVQKCNDPLKTFFKILEEVQPGYDGLVNALADVTSEGYLTADALSTLAKLEKDGALAGLELADILDQDANGYRLRSNALEQYVQKIVAAYEEELKAAEAFASEKDKENAIANLEALRSVLATLVATQNEATDTSKAYRDSLEKEQEMYEGQLDKFGELIELRKDLLQTYKEELDYQKELEKRQRNVATLQTKLAIARLDNSAAGQARVRELEAELKEAQDELEDFTLEHAIDVLTDQLDSTNAEWKSIIQTKLDGITKLLDGLDTSPVVNITTDTSWVQDVMARIESDIAELKKSDVVDDHGQGVYDPSPTINEVIPANGNVGIPREEQSPAYEEDIAASIMKMGNATGSGMKAGNKGDNGIVDWNGEKYKVQNSGTVYNSSSPLYKAAVNLLGFSEGQVFSYNGEIYVYLDEHIQKIEGRALNKKGYNDLEDKYISSALQLYLDRKNEYGYYHTGGLVGDVSTLSTSEEFAKLLKGEFVSTPAQMKRFMEDTLPQIANYTASSGTNEFNAPLIEITCESVTSETLPELKRIVGEAVNEIKRELDSGMSRAGFKRQMAKRLT